MVVYPDKGSHKIHKFANAREGVLKYVLKVLEEDGACLAKCAMNKYKESVFHLEGGCPGISPPPPKILRNFSIIYNTK